LDENGLNIASSLHEFLQSSQRSIDFVKTFKSIIPHVDRIETQEIGTAYLATVFHIGQQELDLPLESDGTLRVLATLVALFQDPPRTVLGLEEPELMVHPGVLGVLADAIKEASERSQMIITTHSPDLIASFDVNDLRVVERGENGTKIGKIDDSQRQIIEDQLFKASDLLRIHGELRGAVSSES
jgi:predicted ATPase